MNPAHLKMLPMVMVVAAMCYCIWPYLQPPSALPAAAEGPEPIASELLEPSIEPAPPRNPFVLPGMPPPEAPTRAQPKAVEKRLTDGARARSDRSPTPAKKPASPLAGLTLGATLVGRRPAAVVNGKVYREGEMIPPGRPDGKELKLARVERDHVVLQDPARPRFLVLAYGMIEAPTKASAPALVGAALPGVPAMDVKPLLSLARGLLGSELGQQLEEVLKAGTVEPQ